MSLKRLIKLGVMTLSASLFRNRGSKILYYHDIFKTTNHKALDAHVCMGTPLDLFKRHVEVIRENGFEIVPNITKPRGQVAIMLDDGFRGIWECRDYFVTQGIFPTVFLPIEYIGRTAQGMLSREEIIELQRLGFNFESHGWSHRPFTAVAEDDLDKELIQSKNHLSRVLGREVTGICMPLGYFNLPLIERIKAAGYEKIYSCLPGNYCDAPHGLITRNLCQFASPREVRLILKGGNELLKRKYARLHLK